MILYYIMLFFASVFIAKYCSTEFIQDPVIPKQLIFSATEER